MNVLLIGSGGREHALAWKLSQSPLLQKLHIAPGNGGTQRLGIHPDLNVANASAVLDYCTDQQIELVVIGPEQPLVDGLGDDLRAQGIKVIGPGKEGAQLEGSKNYSKEFMQRHGIPTAGYAAFESDQSAEAEEHIDKMSTPIVLKADGLAAGKGVLICASHDEAKKEVRQMLDGKFGEASRTVVIEEFLSGIEFSVFALTDGKDYVLLPSAKDYKRAKDGDQGLNTGGMGTVSPVPFVDSNLMKKVVDRIIDPTIQGLAQESIPYIGFIFFGLINVDGDPYVIEYNARLGDPETQVILPRLENDLLDLFVETCNGGLSQKKAQFSSEHQVAVILASGGYPEAYRKGLGIESKESEGLIFHAGTKVQNDQYLTNGGRVMACIGSGESLVSAVEKAYQTVSTVTFEDMFYRKDIGQDLINYEQPS